jgi:hypothetical protein
MTIENYIRAAERLLREIDFIVVRADIYVTWEALMRGTHLA